MINLNKLLIAAPLIWLIFFSALSAEEVNITAETAGLFMTGDFADVAPLGLGGNIGCEYSGIAGTGLGLGFTVGFFTFIPEEDQLKSMTMFMPLIEAGWRLPVTERFALIPFLGGGISYLWINNSESGRSEGLQGVLSAGCSLDFQLSGKFSLSCTPGYIFLFESDDSYQCPTLSLGVKYQLVSLNNQTKD